MVDEDTVFKYTLDGPKVQVIINILDEPRKSVESFCLGARSSTRRFPLSSSQSIAAFAISLAMLVRDASDPKRGKKKELDVLSLVVRNQRTQPVESPATGVVPLAP